MSIKIGRQRLVRLISGRDDDGKPWRSTCVQFLVGDREDFSRVREAGLRRSPRSAATGYFKVVSRSVRARMDDVFFVMVLLSRVSTQATRDNYSHRIKLKNNPAKRADMNANYLARKKEWRMKKRGKEN